MATCLRCNRPLKDQTSIERGYGPVCWAKVCMEHEHENNDSGFSDNFINEPTDEVIVMRRTGKGVETNVPHLVTHHSPDGYEFGYGGSGPADLALNVLEVVLRQMDYKGETTNDTWKKQRCFKLAWVLHQAFKRDFIAGIDHDTGGAIRTNDIISWIRDQEPMFAE